MKVFNLRCSLDHRFEGWFASEDDYLSQLDRGLMVCPVCGSAAIDRLPSAPRLAVSRSRRPAEQGKVDRSDAAAAVTESAPPRDGGPPREMALQSMWLQAVRHVMANTDDVGERFPEEARRMHYGEIDERAIRGRASRDEAEALREEGIEVMSLPLPDSLKGPLQ
ncbi:DUF1178 family protein [Piscinibacter sakaiensis]|uniref:DUF1178 family protein n=1 Tax=Piscinibacter sakaiensis TaxID=1547922 RepID=UPI003AAB44C3